MSNESRRASAAPESTNTRPVLRGILTLSSVAMLIAAGLTFAGVIPLPSLIGYLFLAIAMVDLVIAYVVF